MFAERVKATGGQRFSGTATPGTPGEKTFLKVSSGIAIEGEPLKEGFFNAGIDDKDYNCHSFTFTDAKDSKLGKLKTLAKTIPKEGGDLAGQKYYEAKDLVTEGIHFEMTPSTLIFPRWVLDGEARSYLKAFRPIKAGDKAVKGDVAVYSTNGDLPHSGKVTQIDASGNPFRIKGKWGHYSLFEHAPEAVPAHYGKSSYLRRK